MQTMSDDENEVSEDKGDKSVIEIREKNFSWEARRRNLYGILASATTVEVRGDKDEVKRRMGLMFRSGPEYARMFLFLVTKKDTPQSGYRQPAGFRHSERIVHTEEEGIGLFQCLTLWNHREYRLDVINLSGDPKTERDIFLHLLRWGKEVARMRGHAIKVDILCTPKEKERIGLLVELGFTMNIPWDPRKQTETGSFFVYSKFIEPNGTVGGVE